MDKSPTLADVMLLFIVYINVECLKWKYHGGESMTVRTPWSEFTERTAKQITNE